MTIPKFCLAAVAIVLVVYLLWPAAVPDESAALPRPPVTAATHPQNTLESKAPGAAALPELGTPGFAAMVKERSAAWVAGRNRDAASLVALWDLTGDETLLAEAAARFPDNPRLCVAMISHLHLKDAPKTEQLAWAEKLIAADPDNPLGYFNRAKFAGDPQAVIAAIKRGMECPGRMDEYLRDRILTVKEGMLASGASLDETSLLSLIAPLRQNAGVVTDIALAGTFKTFKTEMESMEKSGNESGRQDLAALGLAKVERLALSESPTMMTELVVNSGRRFFLSELNPATEIVNSGRTAGEERLREEARTTDLTAMLRSEAPSLWLPNAPVEVKTGYVDLFVLKGESAARTWLAGEYEKTGP